MSSFVRALPAALLLALAAPAMAHANASLSISGTAPHETVTYTAGDSDDHSVTAAITLSVVGAVTRSPDAPKRETFVFTVKPPARAKR